MSMNFSHNYYTTSDLGIAVFLLTREYRLIKTSLSGPRRLCFFFERKDGIERDVANYLIGKGEAPAKRLFENYRALRAMTFQETGLAR